MDPNDPKAHKRQTNVHFMCKGNSTQVFHAVLVIFHGMTKASPGGEPSFVGLIVSPQRGVLDTAAEDGCVGSTSLEEISEDLAKYGLKVVWVQSESGPTSCAGIGGGATILGYVDILVYCLLLAHDNCAWSVEC